MKLRKVQGSDEANMTMNPGEFDLGAKKEDEDDDSIKFPKMSTPSSSSSSRQWSSSFKNPRIVRVSRNFGGKDRHSKVCTVRGLRDRRIRLSVPTAIQLYDLQDMLGLTQPSKVIDWLLDATKHEIDKLPPLPMIPTNLLQFHHRSAAILLPSMNEASPYRSNVSEFLSPNLFKAERERWIGSSSQTCTDQHNQGQNNEGFGGLMLSAHNFFPLNSQFSVPDMPYTSNYFQPTLSLSQFGGGYSFSNRTDDQEQTQASTSQMYAFPHQYVENEHFRQMNDNMQDSVMMPTTLHLINNSPMNNNGSSTLSLHSNQNETGEQEDNITTS